MKLDLTPTEVNAVLHSLGMAQAAVTSAQQTILAQVQVAGSPAPTPAPAPEPRDPVAAVMEQARAGLA